MRYEYDVETDILLIRLRDGAPDHGEQTEGIIAHYSPDDELLQLEILDASSVTADMVKTVLSSRKMPA